MKFIMTNDLSRPEIPFNPIQFKVTLLFPNLQVE